MSELVRDPVTGVYVPIGEFITTHDQIHCALCKGAGAHQDEHYALGKLRFAIGHELGLDRETARQLDLSTLLQRRRDFREQLAKEKRHGA